MKYYTIENRLNGLFYGVYPSDTPLHAIQEMMDDAGSAHIQANAWKADPVEDPELPICRECGSQKIFLEEAEPGNGMRASVRCSDCDSSDIAISAVHYSIDENIYHYRQRLGDEYDADL